MLLKALFSVLLAIPKLIISLFPQINIMIPDNVMYSLHTVMFFVGYFVPVKELFNLIMLNFAIESAHIVWTIILRVKSFIPTMGN